MLRLARWIGGLLAICPLQALAAEPALRDVVEHAAGEVVCGSPTDVKLDRRWDGPLCHSSIFNIGKSPVRIREVVLLRVPHQLPGETHLYGEGFTMLSETTGTLAHPVDMSYADRKHYKIPQPADATTVYGLLTLRPPGGQNIVIAFTSCRRFVGRFYVRPQSIEATIDTENLVLQPGQKWELEELMFASGNDRGALLAAVGDRMAQNYPRRPVAEPTGWCSWYCFGPRVTAAQVLANLDVIAKDIPLLRYIQLDDGYQRAMGDWLETGHAFGGEGGVKQVLRQIRQKGFEPAIWVAPFVAEQDSHLFQQHADWFIKDDEGKPLRSDRVTFGGWRRGPWYALDGTHPEAQRFLEDLFRTMRQEWGVTYFKLDANFWGAMQGGHFHDPNATRIEAYRRGMESIRRGAGDAFLLGCNHPVWGSLGLIDGSRSSNDIKRSWKTFAETARMNLNRNWQNGRLWWNDPDCALLTGNLPANEYLFHATAIYATGGMVLAGDDLTRIAPDRLRMLGKLLPPGGAAAQFEDDTFQEGTVRSRDRTMICVLNWGDEPRTISVKLPDRSRVSDYWTGEDLGTRQGIWELKDVPAHGGRLFSCTPDKR